MQGVLRIAIPQFVDPNAHPVQSTYAPRNSLLAALKYLLSQPFAMQHIPRVKSFHHPMHIKHLL
jgi:hypothetical protein